MSIKIWFMIGSMVNDKIVFVTEIFQKMMNGSSNVLWLMFIDFINIFFTDCFIKLYS